MVKLINYDVPLGINLFILLKAEAESYELRSYFVHEMYIFYCIQLKNES